ncbi:MAG TPA: O-antigen ligase family protein [Saprospiraceae bacterium]|nr:O-antigen ligase family protein [Saprospiraceae bacterium]HPN70214.1 O-antigen ligase family protein [Saprospiraceae bacterium]
MSNIKVKSSPLANSVKILFGLIFLVMGLGRTPGLLDEYHLGRFLAFNLVGLWAYFFVFPRYQNLRIHLLDLCFLAYLLISYLSLTWAFLPSAGLVTTQSILLAFAFYIGFRLLSEELSDQFLFRGVAILSLVTVSIGLWQLLKVGLSDGLEGDNIYKVIGMSGHKNLLASFLFLLLGINLYGVVAQKNSKWVYGIMFLQIIVIFLLRSRGVLVALTLLSGFTAIGMVTANANIKKVFFKALLPIIIGGILMGSIAFFTLGGTSEDLKQFNPTQYFKSASGTERVFVWYKTSQVIADQWVTGYGAGNWKIVFPSKGIGGGYRLQSLNVIFSRAHNDFLEVFAELGVFGLLSYLGIFLIPLFALIRQFRNPMESQKVEILTLFGLLMGYMIIAFFDFPKERFEHQILLSYILALIIWRTKSSGGFAFKNGITPTVQKIIFSILPLLLILNLPLSYFQMKGENHVSKSLAGQLSKQWSIMAKEGGLAYSPFFQISPMASSPKWLEGLGFFHQNMFDKAEASLAIAYNHTPYHFQTINDYASCLVKLKKYDQAIEVFKQALSINPKFEDAMFNLSYVYAQKGEFDIALDWANKTKEDAGKKAAFLSEIAKMKGK